MKWRIWWHYNGHWCPGLWRRSDEFIESMRTFARQKGVATAVERKHV